MACVIGVRLALRPLGKTADPALLAEPVKAFFSPGQDLVGIGLVSHVPDDPVPGQVQGDVQGHGQLHGAQVAGQMAAGHTDLVHEKTADLLGQLVILIRRNILYVVDLIDAIQDMFHSPSYLLPCCLSGSSVPDCPPGS